jgi:hypothetical protein
LAIRDANHQRLRVLSDEMNLGGAKMVSKCANPQCSVHMKYMHEGKLFVVPKVAKDRHYAGDAGEFSAPLGKQIECFWLCEVCSLQMTITKNGKLEMQALQYSTHGSATKERPPEHDVVDSRHFHFNDSVGTFNSIFSSEQHH